MEVTSLRKGLTGGLPWLTEITLNHNKIYYFIFTSLQAYKNSRNQEDKTDIIEFI